MDTHAIVIPTVQAEPITAHRLSLINALTPAEKAFIADIGSLLANGLTDAGDAAAKRFLHAAPNAQAARRRAYALLRLADNAINDIFLSQQRDGGVETRILKSRAQT